MTVMGSPVPPPGGSVPFNILIALSASVRRSNLTKPTPLDRPTATHGHNAANITVDHICKLECGPMPNLMTALPNIGGALCSTPQSLADAHY